MGGYTQIGSADTTAEWFNALKNPNNFSIILTAERVCCQLFS